MALFSLSTVLATVFNCVPVAASWDFTIPATCIDSTKFFWVSASINVVTDVALLLLPLPLVWKLQMPSKQKTLISLVFVLGGM